MSRSLEASVVELLRLWSQEMPATIHRHEVFVGPPDRIDNKGPALGAEHSTAKQLVGGSVLGSPAYAEPFRRLIEEDNLHATEASWSPYDERMSATERHLVTPLRSAMRRCGRHFEAYLVDVARNGGDWLTPAQKRGCHDQHIARVYANEAFRRLWREYSVDRPARLPRREKARHPSDDVPWTERSESQQNAEDAA